MPSLAGFAAFARKVGVPHVPQAAPAWGTDGGTEKIISTQTLSEAVPLVPLVPPQNDVPRDDEDWQAAYDERAAILEYDEGLPRAEAERLARMQVFGDRPCGNVKLTATRENA